MPKRQQPASFTAGRALNLAGTAYAAGAAIPNAAVKATKHLSAYLSRRWIVPNVDPLSRKAGLKNQVPRPTDLSAKELNNLP